MSNNPKKAQRPIGWMLLETIKQRCYEQGLDPNEVAREHFDIGKVYWGALNSNRRHINRIEDEKLHLIAKWLRLPMLQIYLLAGKLTTEDCYFHSDIEDQMSRGYKELCKDPFWQTIAPPEQAWNETPTETKLCLLAMYEKLTCETYLQKAIILNEDSQQA